MPTLAIDTATDTLSIAVGDGGELAGETTVAAGRSHLELLLSLADELLGDLGLRRSSLEAVVVGVGPGTFSGLRVGVATARALAQSLELPLAASSSLAALAAGLAAAPGSGDRLLPVIDARRGQVFSQLFSRDDAGKVTPQSEIMCLSANDLLAAVRQETAAGVYTGGNGAQAYREQFESAVNVTLPDADDDSNLIHARYHLPVADRTAGRGLEDIMGVLPVYVRAPDADKTILLRKREPWLE